MGNVIRADSAVNWTNPTNIWDDDLGTHGSIDAAQGDGAEQEQIEWSALIISGTPVLNLKFACSADVDGAGGGDFGTARYHLEYSSDNGVTWSDICVETTVGPTTESSSQTDTIARALNLVANDLGNLIVRADIFTSFAGAGTADASVQIFEAWVEVHSDAFGGFQPV